eukprot:COSAG05_NODE_8139_length_732_cov_2.028436_2_plen_140_part_00
MLGGGEPAESHVWLWPQLNTAVHVLICADGYVLGGGEAVGSHVWLGLQLNAAGYEVFYANGYLVASYDGIRRILCRHRRFLVLPRATQQMSKHAQQQSKRKKKQNRQREHPRPWIAKRRADAKCEPYPATQPKPRTAGG